MMEDTCKFDEEKFDKIQKFYYKNYSILSRLNNWKTNINDIHNFFKEKNYLLPRNYEYCGYCSNHIDLLTERISELKKIGIMSVIETDKFKEIRNKIIELENEIKIFDEKIIDSIGFVTSVKYISNNYYTRKCSFVCEFSMCCENDEMKVKSTYIDKLELVDGIDGWEIKFYNCYDLEHIKLFSSEIMEYCCVCSNILEQITKIINIEYIDPYCTGHGTVYYRVVCDGFLFHKNKERIDCLFKNECK